MNAGVRRVLVLVLAHACVTFSGCNGATDLRAENVLLISIDTLRADALGCYGHALPDSPALDSVAARGVLFEDAWSTSPWTLPAHASLLTGLYPSRHGVNDLDKALPEQVETLQAVLSQNGFTTAAIVNSVLIGRKHGFDRGFSEFTRLREKTGPRGAAPEITAGALDWLARHESERFFLFLHYYDVHSDYNPLPEYRQELVAPYNGPVDGTTRQLLHYRQSRESLAPADVAHLRSLYVAGVRQLDDQLGRLFEFLDEQGLADKTLVVITSDHGEEFLEHGGLLHGRTQFQELIHVPLIMRGPGLPAGRRVDVPASLVDVMPTILAQLDIEAPARRDGMNLAVTWQSGSRETSARQIFAEADHNNVENDIKRAIRDGEFKLHFDRRTQQIQLYDLYQDGGEQQDLASEEPAVAAALLSDLRQFMDVKSKSQQADSLTEEEMQRLRSLGYTQ